MAGGVWRAMPWLVICLIGLSGCSPFSDTCHYLCSEQRHLDIRESLAPGTIRFLTSPSPITVSEILPPPIESKKKEPGAAKPAGGTVPAATSKPSGTTDASERAAPSLETVARSFFDGPLKPIADKRDPASEKHRREFSNASLGGTEECEPESAMQMLPDPKAATPNPSTHPAVPQEGDGKMSLDEAIRLALQNTKVVRLLAGTAAVSSGGTIYDPAISNTAIDDAKSVFDPTLNVRNNWNRIETPTAILDPADPNQSRITGIRTDNYNLAVGVSKRNVLGGVLGFDYAFDRQRFTPGVFPLNPSDRSTATLSYTQPLLQGAGPAVNLAPIVIARINTERSYFQFKGSMQELVRGVIEGYWAVVFARTDVETRKLQVQQGQEAYELADARMRTGLGNAADAAQAKVALSNFRASLIASEANLLAREAALRNILGLPPAQPERIIPTSMPTDSRVEPRWEDVLHLAEERRPDLVELKLILEADFQTLIQAKNQALPRVDTTLLYRWNGLEGETPAGTRLATGTSQFTDWTVGVNFSVPLGLRQGRAGLRRAELVLDRDRANLEQGLHAASHSLAQSLRNLAQFYEQYKAFQETREAAKVNLVRQLADFRLRGGLYLNVLQAISDWGNAVSSEAQALLQYNTELATLERETGTILETHGIRFAEERFGSIGPLGRLALPQCYPKAVVPTENNVKYPGSDRPTERFFQLDPPVKNDSQKRAAADIGSPGERPQFPIAPVQSSPIEPAYFRESIRQSQPLIPSSFVP